MKIQGVDKKTDTSFHVLLVSALFRITGSKGWWFMPMTLTPRREGKTELNSGPF